jgi:hypothetical protein
MPEGRSSLFLYPKMGLRNRSMGNSPVQIATLALRMTSMPKVGRQLIKVSIVEFVIRRQIKNISRAFIPR